MPINPFTKRISVLWFILATAVLWLLMSTSSNRASRYFTVYLHSDRLYFDSFGLQDSAAPCRIHVEAEGIQSLFLQRFREREVRFEAAQWLQFDRNGCFLTPASVRRILEEHHGAGYQFTLLSEDTLRFATQPYDTLAVPVVLPTSNIVLPEDYRWIVEPYGQVDTLWVVGPESELLQFKNKPLPLPLEQWAGAASFTLNVPQPGKHLQIWPKTLTVSAESAQWVERTFERTPKPLNQSIEIWVSGPRTWLADQALLDKHVQVHWNFGASGTSIWAQSSLSQIQVLGCSPAFIPAVYEDKE